ncbi:hypothetical protein Tco_0511704 [Tanacetum coccineum]
MSRYVKISRKVMKEAEDVREFFQQQWKRSKEKLSRCGMNQYGIWKHALEKGMVLLVRRNTERFLMKDCMATCEIDFEANTTGKEKCRCCKHGVKKKSEAKNEFENRCRTSIWRDVRPAIEEAKRQSNLSILERKTMFVGFRLNNRWLSSKEDIASWRGTDDVVDREDEIFSRWGYCDNHDLIRLDNQSIERDRLIGIGFVLNFVKFISFTFGDKEMISVIEAVSR